MNIEKMPGPAYEAENDKVVDPAMGKSPERINPIEDDVVKVESVFRDFPELEEWVVDEFLEDSDVGGQEGKNNMLGHTASMSVLLVALTGCMGGGLDTVKAETVNGLLVCTTQGSDSAACKKAKLDWKNEVTRNVDEKQKDQIATKLYNESYRRTLKGERVPCDIYRKGYMKKSCREGVSRAKEVLRDRELSKQQNQVQRNSDNGPYSGAQPGGMSPADKAQAKKVDALKKARGEFNRKNLGHFK